MKGPFENLPDNVEQEIYKKWKSLKERDKEYFINQIALFLSVVGTDKDSKDIIAILMERAVKSKSPLTDFPQHLKWFIQNGGVEIYKTKERKLKRALHLLEIYSVKPNLS